MVVTPDHSTLIVAETYAHGLTAFDIAVDGSLSNRRLWADLPGSFHDGMPRVVACCKRSNWIADASPARWVASLEQRCS